MTPHDEYHIYTTNSSIEKVHVHLTEDVLSQAELLADLALPVSNGWDSHHELEVGDNVYLEVETAPPGEDRLSLISYSYEGAYPVGDGDFLEEVFFDDMIFHQCIGTDGFDPDWSLSKVRDWVLTEHRDLFDTQFEEYLEEVKNESYTEPPYKVDR